MSPSSAYIVGEQGFEIGTGSQLMSHARSLDFLKDAMGAGSVVYNINAPGADLGASNRIARGIEAAHNSAVATSVQANAERMKRTPQRS